jgi:hypothetical protein
MSGEDEHIARTRDEHTSSGECRPGSAISVGSEVAVLCAFMGHQGDLFGVTVGHACRGRRGAPVHFFDRGRDFELGRVETFIFDGTDDVGVIRVTRRELCQRKPENDFTLVDPFPAARLGDVMGRRCRVYFGHHQRDSGQINAAIGQGRLRVTSPQRSIPGDSGSPSFVEMASGWRLVGQYLGLESDRRLKRFQHPGPGLQRLGYSL